MCGNCNFRHIHKFESENEWQQFDIDFTKMYVDQLILIEKNRLNSNGISAYDLYKCKSCQSLWAYSYPDNAWRGFFLPEKLAIDYEKQLKRKDRIKGFVGVSILLLILIVTIKSCMK